MNFLEAVSQLTRQNYMSSKMFRLKLTDCGILVSNYKKSPNLNNYYWDLWYPNIYTINIFLATDWELLDRRSEDGDRRAKLDE